MACGDGKFRPELTQVSINMNNIGVKCFGAKTHQKNLVPINYEFPGN